MDKNARKIVWNEYALKAVEAHAQALKAKAKEIAVRCKLRSVNDYTVTMALKELKEKMSTTRPQTFGLEGGMIERPPFRRPTGQARLTRPRH